MGFYASYVGPGIRYLTYATFLTTIIMFGMQLRKIYQSECRVMVFDALGKPAIPAGIFLILFFWKNINEFVMRSVLVSGEKKEPDASPSSGKKSGTSPSPSPGGTSPPPGINED